MILHFFLWIFLKDLNIFLKFYISDQSTKMETTVYLFFLSVNNI